MNCFVTCSPNKVNTGARSVKRLLLKLSPENSFVPGPGAPEGGAVELFVAMAVPRRWQEEGKQDPRLRSHGNRNM
jgi:hypothetical protein